MTLPGSELLGQDQTAVLYALARSADPMSGRAVAQRAGRSSHATTLRILKNLNRVGLVGSTRVGNATAYVLNRQHVLWQPIFDILASPALVEERIMAVVRDLAPNAIVAVFGSFARRDGTPQSDIDILVVLSEPDDELAVRVHDALVENVGAFTGNEIQPVVLDRATLQVMVASDDPLVHSLQADAHDLAGNLGPLLSK